MYVVLFGFKIFNIVEEEGSFKSFCVCFFILVTLKMGIGIVRIWLCFFVKEMDNIEKKIGVIDIYLNKILIIVINEDIWMLVV